MEENEVIIDNKVQVDLETLLKEAFKRISYNTKVDICNYKILDNGKVELTIDGDSNGIAVLKDRLGIKESNQLVDRNAVGIIKKMLYDTLKDNFELLELKLNSIDNTEDIAFIYLDAKLDEIPYPVNITYKVYSNGDQGMSYRVFGDTSKDETWSASFVTLEQLVSKLKGIAGYYGMRRIED